MTTIAYKDGIIACDSRITSGNTILSDHRDKRSVRGDVQFFLSGADHAVARLVGGWPSPAMPCDHWNAFVIDDEGFWFCGSSDGELWKCPQLHDEPMAIGSGADHALTAMDMGCSAEQAVEMASRRDSGTGGAIRTYEVIHGSA